MEGTTSKLSTNEIRCPYCRKKQTGVLPYYEELGLNKINGVNYIDPKTHKSSYNSNYNTCEFLNENVFFRKDFGQIIYRHNATLILFF